jgi:hypothetical protein
MIGASIWFVAVAAADVVIVGLGTWRLLDAVGVAMLAGVLFQAIVSAVAYLAPLIVDPSDGERRAKRTARIDRTGAPRTLAWNGGAAMATAAAAAGPAGGVAWSTVARSGWGLLIVGAVVLVVAALAPTRERR